ncbi:MAG TPA: redoxin domain-containing protein [Polyangium sp.]|nr:redoxin domain-containing protein [Polyangium sp.]
MPAVLALHERFQARGLRVSGVSEFDSTDAESERKSVTDAAHEEKMVYPTFLDDKGIWSKKHDAASIPAFLVVSREGKIIFRHRGKLVVDSPVYAQLSKAIESAL